MQWRQFRRRSSQNPTEQGCRSSDTETDNQSIADQHWEQFPVFGHIVSIRSMQTEVAKLYTDGADRCRHSKQATSRRTQGSRNNHRHGEADGDQQDSGRVGLHDAPPNSRPSLRTRFFYGVFYLPGNRHKLFRYAYAARRGRPRWVHLGKARQYAGRILLPGMVAQSNFPRVAAEIATHI